MRLDPQLNGYLAVWFAGINEIPDLNSSSPDFAKSVKSSLENLLIEKGLYKDLNRTVDQLKSWAAYYNNLNEVAQQRAELVRDFKRVLRVSAVPRMNYEKKRFLLDDFTAYQQREKERQFALNRKVKAAAPKEGEDRKILSISGPSHEEVAEVEHQKALTHTRTLAAEALRNSEVLQGTAEYFNNEAAMLSAELKARNTSVVANFNRLSVNWNDMSNADILKEFVLTVLLCIFTGADMSKTQFPYKFVKSKDPNGLSVIASVVNQYNNLRAAWQPKAILLQ
jgi:uncharacterized integral membrane protein